MLDQPDPALNIRISMPTTKVLLFVFKFLVRQSKRRDVGDIWRNFRNINIIKVKSYKVDFFKSLTTGYVRHFKADIIAQRKRYSDDWQ